jgi:hypothetical protein
VNAGSTRVIKLYQPWPAPVQAACFRDETVLPEIEQWVTTLRERGGVPTEVGFAVRRRRGALVGVLHDRLGEHELTPGAFLVFGRCGLHVLEERAFFQRYQDPDRDRDL